MRFQLVLMVAVAIGFLDNAGFLASKWSSLKANRGRLAGTLVFTLLWLVLFYPVAVNAVGFCIALSAFLLLAGIGLLYVHLKHHIATWRVYVAPAAAGIALIASLASL